MNREEILETLEMLAKGQGLYGRLLAQITDGQLDVLVEQNFKGIMDLVMFIEG